MSQLTQLGSDSVGTAKVQTTVTQYADMWSDKGGEEKRKENYTTLVNQYYDLSTDFYEYGWGTSFHFAPVGVNETYKQAIARHEHYLALKLKLQPNHKVLDVGCGIGGPLTEICRFSGAHVDGLNNNEHQLKKAAALTKKNGIADNCGFIKADFMKMPIINNAYDAVYAIEATCHAPSKEGIYGEIFRVLKPGGYFAAYEWCLTDKFVASNPEHQKIKADIEIGDGLPDIDTIETVLKALKKVGFEIVESEDMAPVSEKHPTAWYDPFEPAYTMKGFRATPFGITITHYFVSIMETLRLAPKGTTQTHSVLMRAADGLYKGGKDRLFTPMFFFLVRKPEN